MPRYFYITFICKFKKRDKQKCKTGGIQKYQKHKNLKLPKNLQKSTFIFLGRQANRRPNVPLIIAPPVLGILREYVQITGKLAFLPFHPHRDVSRVVIVQIVTATVEERGQTVHGPHMNAHEVLDALPSVPFTERG